MGGLPPLQGEVLSTVAFCSAPFTAGCVKQTLEALLSFCLHTRRTRLLFFSEGLKIDGSVWFEC